MVRICSGRHFKYLYIDSFHYFAILVIAGSRCTGGQREDPVQYAKRVVGRKMHGGQSTHIPLKINQAGVIPVIFASSITLFPATLASFFPNSKVATWIAKCYLHGASQLVPYYM